MVRLCAGRFCGAFELLEEAGAGGFSVVWKARRTPDGALFALKFPRVESLLGHLRREARLAQQIDDPRIVTVLETHLDHDPPFLVTPWIAGYDLPVPERCPLPQDQVRCLERALQLAAIVQSLHQRGLVHGDIKPGNLRVAADGRLRLLDFGLARLHLQVRKERSLAQSLVSVAGKNIAGTLDYMAPEQLEDKPITTASDLYSVGVLLHRLMTGRPPSFGVAPEELNPFLPPGLQSLLLRLLQRDPARRLSDAGELCRSLQRLLVAERRCQQRAGHERRRIFVRRLHTLRRGLRALLMTAAGIAGLVGFVVLANAVRALNLLGGLAVGTLLLFSFPALLLGITTINAWLLGVPERDYKQRPGHPLWSFMMQ